MRFWLEKGVSGFRLDVINMISKPAGLPDARITNHGLSPYQSATEMYCNGPRVHDFLKEMRREALEPYGDEVMTVGEVICTESPALVREYTDSERKELDMVYTYDIFGLDMGPGGKFVPRPWRLSEFKHNIAKWQNALAYSKGAWQTIWLESHDSARCVSRFGNGVQMDRVFVATMLALLQSTLGGTMFIYQGQELGLMNLDPSIPLSEYRDVETRRTWTDLCAKRAAEQGIPEALVDMADVLQQVHLKARDHARAPLPWHPFPNHAGFSMAPPEVKPWSPMNTDQHCCNILHQTQREGSILKCWQRRIALRKKYAEALVFGDFEVVESTMGDHPIFAYWRRPLLGEHEKVKGRGYDGNRDVLVVLNLTEVDGVTWIMPFDKGGERRKFFVVDYTYAIEENDRKGTSCSGEVIRLGKYQGVVFAF